MKRVWAVWTVFLTILALPCQTGNAQIHKFQLHNSERGLCNDFVYSIAQDKHGFIWFATGLGLCRYDGFRYFSPEEDLPSTNVNASFRDDRGNLWFGYQNGIIVKYDGIDFSIADTSVNAVVTQIIQSPGGEILAATQNAGIVRIGRKTDIFTAGFENVFINTICFVNDERLMVGTHDGLYLYQYGSDRQDLPLIAKDDNLNYFTVKYITPKENGDGYWVATETDGIFSVTVEDDRFSAERLNIQGLEEARVQSVYEDMQGNLWISTYIKGLYRAQLSTDMNILRTTNYNSENGLGSEYVKQVFSDNQYNIWVATSGHGVASITNTAFSFFEGLEPIGNNALSVFSEDNSEYWIAGQGTIIKYSAKARPVVWGRAEGVPNDKITVLRADDKGNMWIGTETSGLFRLLKDARRVTQFYREDNSLSNNIQSFILADDKIWMATRSGVLVINQQTARKIEQYNTFDGNLPHNNIHDIFEDSQNRIWIATSSNSLIDLKTGKRLNLPDNMETKFVAVTEDEQKRLWAATEENGVFLFDELRDTVYHFSTYDELKSNYCYAIASDGNGFVWIGHRAGLTSINIQRLTVNTYGADNGIRGDVNLRAMILNKSGELLIGMTDGVMMYDINTDKPNVIVPMLNISQILINDVAYNPFKTIVLPYDKYKIQFDFVGLQYANPGAVSYQYQLLGHDTRGWTPPSKSNIAIYPRVEYGDFIFWVRACNSETCTEETMLFTFKVRKPFYLTAWFILLIVAAIVGLGYIVIAIRERNHRIFQEYLENELKARTREVRKQKEEIEIKNRDITDSINYAQRIQFSVLPSTSTLLEHCSGAFIFYRPRDIVSGDFYWFDYFPKNNRLLIVCADSTGHGVPGAFMSLIGTTLIKDIAMRSDVLNPADILYRLDENVQSTLNQNRDSEQANDGMDIIVCEINTKKYIAKIASAMRPYVIYHKGKPTTYKCSRSSIGGQHAENKAFNTNELQLSKGDSIYMFTDGYTDQFGGPSGKKLKMNRLQNILDDIHNRDMDEQYRVVKENFDLWKGHNAQVDDVLMIGVKL